MERLQSELIKIDIAAVAQWIEYWPPKPRVVGSIPASRTTKYWSKLVLFLANTVSKKTLK